ncbi:3'-5' exonuclease [Methylorubrum extorquens]|uniref:3'-5' exonuclease n=1 Tax=Methylorubrum extorquens TaxID=408 RepID=UPI00209CCDD6|nr:3'-5' exonuclease [Methylorubrum extorquens]MCP1539978.1 DNA polymerase-3 subunit epsilon [Methylorubrum extorquens]
MSILVAGWDTETTGLQYGDHRFVEIAILTYDLLTEKLVDSYVTKIDPQRSIPADVQRIHGIGPKDVEGCPTWEEVAPEAHKRLEAATFTVAHNGAGFDLPFVNYELRRVRLPELTKPLVDTMLHGRGTTPNGAVPNLRVFCSALGIEYDPALAHRAEYDVDVMMRAFFNARRWGAFRDLPEETALALAA